MIRYKNTGVLCLMFTLLGCGDSASPPPKEDLVPVTGTVKIGGKPAVGIYVSFVPSGSTKGQGASGVTDEKGEFELEHNATHEPGIAAGDYQAKLSKWILPDGSPLPKDTAPHMVNAKNLIPESWEKGSGGNTMKVPPGGTKFDFDIPEG
jgi:hypothetical protein